VYPNPIHDEGSGEYINLYTQKTIALEEYHLETPSGNISLPHETLYEGQYLLIAEEDFEKDNESWPDADIVSPITLRNTEGYIKLWHNQEIENMMQWKTSHEGKAISKNESR